MKTAFLSGCVVVLMLLSHISSAGIGEGRERPVRTYVDGVPVYSYGSTYILGEPPNLTTGTTTLQSNNKTPMTKMKLKKSWEIKENHLGANPPNLPRTEMMDRWQAPLLSINLIDNNPGTYWSCRGQARPDVEPAWIRLDLPVETTITAVNFVRRYHPGAINDNTTTDPEQRSSINGDGLPRKLQIKVSRDARNWDTVYQTDFIKIKDDQTTVMLFAFDPRPVKQIWVVGEVLPLVDLFIYQPGYAMSLAEIQAIDEHNENVALATRGTGITVSSTEYGYSDSRYIQHDLWATAWDMGIKYCRVAAWDSVLQWSYVERTKKGEFNIDPVADRAITELHDNGINVLLGLSYSNWLYTPQGKRPYDPSLADFTDIAEKAPIPLEGELRTAFMNFVRKMALHFKDRVEYYYLWNEPYADPPYGFKDPKAWTDFFAEKHDVITKVDPKAKFAWPTATEPFYKASLKEGIGKYLDFGMPRFNDYEEWVKLGHKPDKTCTYEFWTMASYPWPPERRNAMVGVKGQSELDKAKSTIGNAIQEAGQNSYFCITEWYNSYNVIFDVGLFRNTFSADPYSPSQPQPAYYAFRNICTLLAEAEPFNVNMGIGDSLPWPNARFMRNGMPYVAIWSGNTAVDVRFPGVVAKRAVGYDALNGWQQELTIRVEGDTTIVPGFEVIDTPRFIELLK